VSDRPAPGPGPPADTGTGTGAHQGPHHGADASAPVEAWRAACRRLTALGDRLADDDFPSAPGDRVAGVAHLAEQVICWVGWSVFHADARRPAFQRHNDLVTQWGGPNADNVYRHAPVDAARRYRITGRMHACDEFILAVRAGFMHQARWGTLHEVTASELGIGPGDDVDLVVGEGGDVPLPEGAAMVSIREYYFDWRPEEPAVLTIERLDDDDGDEADGDSDDADEHDAAELARRLDEAVTGVERSLEYWNDYLRARRAEHPPNTFAAPLRLAKGLQAARYGFCFWDLGPGEALVVETDAPDARYWSFQLYQLGWFELVDLVERQSSLNHTQAMIDRDDRVRVVVAHDDPGVANWLDTGGRPAGLLTFRWFWSSADPAPAARVVPLGRLAATLPPGTATCTPSERAETLRRRRRHLAWRFRT
jgi:hypothetical protein